MFLFRNEEAPKLLKIIQYILSISVSNAVVERVFSVMGNICTDERNRLAVKTIWSELCIFFNLSYSGTDFQDIVTKNKQLIKSVQSNSKYKPKEKSNFIKKLLTIATP